MKKLLPLIFVLALLFGCSKNQDNFVKIRISNISDFDYEKIKVADSGELIDFGDLKSGEISEYKEFREVYDIAYFELYTDGEFIKNDLVDNFGKKPLENGKYLLKIEAEVNDSVEKIFSWLVNE